MGRLRRPAPVHERALVGLRAVLADRHLRQRLRQHRQLVGDHLRHGFEQQARRLGHVRPGEQIAQVWIGARPIEVHDLHPGHLHPALGHDVGLHRHVRQVLLLHLRGRLHFDHDGAARLTLQNVHRDEHPARAERRLVDDRLAPADRVLRRRDALVIGPVGQIDQHAAGHIGACDLADQVAAVEERLEGLVRLELRRGRLVHRPPEPLVALEPRHHARFGEARA